MGRRKQVPPANERFQLYSNQLLWGVWADDIRMSGRINDVLKKTRRWTPAKNLTQTYVVLEKVRSIIQEFSNALEQRDKKLADIKPLLDIVDKEYMEKRNRLLTYDFEQKKAAIIQAAKNRQGFFDSLVGSNPITKEVEKEIKDAKAAFVNKVFDERVERIMEILTAKEKEQRKDMWYAFVDWEREENWPHRKEVLSGYYYGKSGFPLSALDFHGYSFSKFGLEVATLDEKTALHNIEFFKAQIERAKAEERKLLLKHGIGDNVVAAAAAHFGTTRELADKIKRDLEGQLAVTKDCPYCGLPLGDAMHADHIYRLQPPDRIKLRSLG